MAEQSDVEVNAIDRIPECADFQQIRCAAPRYRWRRVRPDGNVVPQNPPLNATTDAIFRFGNGYNVNLARTRLCYTEIITAQGANTWVLPKLIPGLDRIRMQTSTGTVLVDIPDFQAHFMLVRDWNISRSEWLTRGRLAPMMGSALGVSGYAYGAGEVSCYNYASPLLCRRLTGDITNDNRCNGAIGFPFGYNPGAAAYPLITVAAARTGGFARLDEPEAFGVMASDWGQPVGVDTAVALVWDLPFRDLMPHTVCVVDQDLYFGADIMVTFTHSAGSERGIVLSRTHANGDAVLAAQMHLVTGLPSVFAWANTGANAGASPHTGVVGGAGQLTVAPTIVNGSYCIQLCTQDNSELIAAIREEIMGPGLSLPVQVFELTKTPTNWLSNLAASQGFSTTRNLNLSKGMAALRVYSALANIGVNGVQSTDGAADASTWSGDTRIAPIAIHLDLKSTLQNASRIVSPPTYGVAKWVGYRTYFNALPTSDSLMDPIECFNRMRDMIRKSDYPARTIGSWCYTGGVVIEDFIDGYPLHNHVQTTPLGGMSLVNPVQIQTDFQSGAMLAATSLGTTAQAGAIGNLQLVQEVVFAKILRMSQAGIFLESS